MAQIDTWNLNISSSQVLVLEAVYANPKLLSIGSNSRVSITNLGEPTQNEPYKQGPCNIDVIPLGPQVCTVCSTFPAAMRNHFIARFIHVVNNATGEFDGLDFEYQGQVKKGTHIACAYGDYPFCMQSYNAELA